MDGERFIETLKREQAHLALASLRSPNNKDTFEFGLLSGMVQAYDRMLTILQEQQDEEAGKPKKKEVKSLRPINPYLDELDRAATLPEQFKRR